MGAPILFAAYICGCYWYARSKGAFLADDVIRDWLFFFVFGFCLISGLIVLEILLKVKIWLRIVLGIIYCLCMAVFMLFLGIYVASFWGDYL